MNDTTKWIIGLIIVVAIVWFGYTSMQDDEVIEPTDVEMTETAIDENIDPTVATEPVVDEVVGEEATQ